MSEEKVEYEVPKKVLYETEQDIYEEFLRKTKIDLGVIEGYERYMRTGEIKIWLTDGSYIIYGK